ncbi:MAG: hypothetical protein ACREID_02400 [Planctomycetota bacterium]
MNALKISLALVATLAAGCGKEETGGATPAGHDHPPAPHGGEVLDLGDGDAHLEMIHDHAGGNVTVYVLGADLKTPIAVEMPVIQINRKGLLIPISLTPIDPAPDGKATGWKGSHVGLKADPWDGRIRVTIGDKNYQSPLEAEGHEH